MRRSLSSSSAASSCLCSSSCSSLETLWNRADCCITSCCSCCACFRFSSWLPLVILGYSHHNQIQCCGYESKLHSPGGGPASLSPILVCVCMCVCMSVLSACHCLSAQHRSSRKQ
ncbi:hypothetical protein AMECASPLE_028932 [Ameca splendens]|uniref:Secreted protein n=1 Tax=Ameca splendens TaxID=208324 RepID=A0ABV1AE17_9TELE